MITEEIKKIIEETPIAFATSSDGKPNVIAVACVAVVSENQIIITDNYMKQTKENLEKNKNVCLAVWNQQGGYKLIGTAEYFTEGKWKDFVEQMPKNKDHPAKGAILVAVSNVVKLG